jgi:hypothetical protein
VPLSSGQFLERDILSTPLAGHNFIDVAHPQLLFLSGYVIVSRFCRTLPQHLEHSFKCLRVRTFEGGSQI